MERYSLNHLFRMLGCFMLCIMFTATAFAQQKTIKGTDVDATGEPLIGVNVSVKGTTIGIITDIDGNYTLEVPSKSTIVFSYIGYQTQEVAVSNQSTINVTLKEDTQKLEEVVVVGYGTQKKVTVTGSVASVSGEELKASPTTNLTNGMVGRMPGVIGFQTADDPGGGGTTIRIRGTISLGSNVPLVVIVGVPDRDGGMNRLNPTEIESISVLKDASAAIYGARAANGVILITTKRGKEGKPVVSAVILILIILGWLGAELSMTKDPTYMDLLNYNKAPNAEFLFGTDTMGRDIFSMIWYGGRISILIGGLATVISTFIAVVVGAFSGVAPAWLDELIMRFTEIFLSIPTLLLIILLQAIMGDANILSLSFVIGVTSWTSIAKVVRTEVRQIRNSEYIIAARCMGAGFFRILWKHLVPNFFSSIMFMVVMNVRTAMISEATLSFMGIGLPIEVITWGSMLSLSDKALMTGSWWIILIPGLFLITTVLCLTNIGNACREQTNRKESNF